MLARLGHNTLKSWGCGQACWGLLGVALTAVPTRVHADWACVVNWTRTQHSLVSARDGARLELTSSCIYWYVFGSCK